MRDKEFGKWLAWALRHTNPSHPGFYEYFDEVGFMPVEEVIAFAATEGIWTNREQIITVANDENNDRFEVSPDGNFIRATRGHSFPLGALVPREEASRMPDILYHGTSTEAAKIILKEGIKAMNRTYPHFSPSREKAGKIGQRHGKPYIFEIHRKHVEEFQPSLKFYKTKGDVWLAGADIIPEVIVWGLAATRAARG